MIKKNYSELFEFTATQLAALKRAYMPLKGKTLTMPQINKLKNMLSKLSTDQLVKLANTDIPFVATGAKSMAVMNRGMKWSDFKQGLDMSEADELQCEACWTGYKQVGLKKKGDRMVPNCVPESKELLDMQEVDLTKRQVKMVHKAADKLAKEMKVDEAYEEGTPEYVQHTMKMTPGQPIQNFRVSSEKIVAKDIEKFKNEGETIDKYKKRFKENWKIELDKAVEKMKEQL